MPKRRYAFDLNGSQRLLITWQGGLHYRQGDLKIMLDGIEIGSIPDQGDLKERHEFTLPDASKLSIQETGSELQVFRGGRDLKIVNQWRRDIQSGRYMLAVVSFLDIAGGVILALWMDRPETLSLLLLMVCGVLFFGLFLWARQTVKIPMILAIGLFVFQMAAVLKVWQITDVWVFAVAVFMIVDVCMLWFRAVRSFSRGSQPEAKA